MGKLYSILLKQHVGYVNKPVVEVGDKVNKGSLIAIPTKLGANIHASVSGFIKGINDKSIIIEADDNQSSQIENIKVQGSISEIVKEAGIVGMGGAGFPTHIKLDVNIDGGVVIANGVECEPLLSHNIHQLIENPEVVYKGLKYAMEATNASTGIIAIKEKNTEAIRSVEKIIKDENIRIVKVDDIYPMGEERAIIRDVLGKLLTPDQLPIEANSVVLNVETLSRIAEAIDLKMPSITKNITVVGKLKNGINAQVFEKMRP